MAARKRAASGTPAAGGGARPSAFDALTTEQVKAALNAGLPEYLEASAKFIAGDHWQDGAGWIGPKPPASSSMYDTAIGLIKEAFISKNVIAEIVERHMSGVVGREPSFTIVPRRADIKENPITDAEKAAIEEITTPLAEWWEARRIHQLVQDAVARMLWATRSPARLYVPPGMMTNQQDGTGEIVARTLRGALAKLYAETLPYKAATVVTDPDTKAEIGVYAVEAGGDPFGRESAGGEKVFVSHLEGEDPAADPGEPSYRPPRTVIRQIAAGKENAGASGAVDLGGRITMHEMRRPPLITLQVQQANKAINLAATMSPRTIVTAGFLSRIITNAQLRGKTIKDPNGGGDIFIPEPPEFGPGITTFLEGLEEESNGRQGGTKKATPGVQTIPAQPVTPLIEAKRAHYEDALEEADQVHVLINGDATPSGKSREEARADYVMSLLMTAAPTLAFLRWILETALAYAEAMLGTPGKWTSLYRIEVRLRMSTGKPSTAERERNAADVKASLLSRESALEANDVADPDAELARMAGDPISEYAEAEALGLAVGALVTAGASFEGACRYLDLDPDDVADLVGANDESTPDPDPEADPDGGAIDDTVDGEPQPADSGNDGTPGTAGGTGGNASGGA